MGDRRIEALATLLPDLLSIGQFSRRCRLPVSTLRYYHEIGLLIPAHVDPNSGYRYYSAYQLQAAVLIAEMRALGVGPEAIKLVLAGGPGAGTALRAERERLGREMRRREAALNYIEGALAASRHIDLSRCQMVTLVPQAAVAVSGLIEAEEAVGQVARLVAAVRLRMRREGLVATGPAGAMFPLDLVSSTTRVLAFVPVEAAADSVQLPSGDGATVTYRGDVRGVAVAYKALIDWIEQQGMTPLEPLIEEYITESDGLAIRLTALVAV